MTSAVPKSGDRLVTAEEFAQMPDDAPSELVRGRIVDVSLPTVEHGFVCGNLVRLVGTFVHEHRLGLATCNDAGHWIARDPDNVRGPDVWFVATERIPEEGIPEKWWPSSPELAVEVISPNDRYSEVEERTRDWLDGGAQDVWLVDSARREIKVVRSDGSTVVSSTGQTLESSLLHGLALRVEGVFSVGADSAH